MSHSPNWENYSQPSTSGIRKILCFLVLELRSVDVDRLGLYLSMIINKSLLGSSLITDWEGLRFWLRRILKEKLRNNLKEKLRKLGVERKGKF